MTFLMSHINRSSALVTSFRIPSTTLRAPKDIIFIYCVLKNNTTRNIDIIELGVYIILRKK